MMVHPVSRDSNPLQDRKEGSGLKSKRRQSKGLVVEETVKVVSGEVAVDKDDEWDYEIEYAPPKREYGGFGFMVSN